MDPLKAIAAGGDATWEKTYNHPKYGDLIFRVPQLPKGQDWLRHAAQQDELIVELGGNPNAVSDGTALLAAAIVGLRTIIQPPVISEERVEDAETSHETIKKTYYDALEDESTDLAMEVWLNFMSWRMELMKRVTAGELGNSSGETNGSDSDEQSLEPTASPSMTPA